MSEVTATGSGIDLKIEGLVKRFGNNTVLEDLNLEAFPGEFLTVVGRSGCGKTTLLRLIAGLEKISGGRIRLDDLNTTTLHPQIKVMFQDARLLPWQKVLDNVRLGLPKDARAKAHQVLHEVGLGAKANEFPSTLSGGQKQRVALARALVSSPRLLLLDEPLGALDALTRIEMQRLLEDLWHEQKFTAFLITHDVEEAVVLGDRVILLEEGKIVLDVKIDLPRPRARGTAEFAALVDQIRSRVMNQDSFFNSELYANAA
jgi:sulfonate transport system ATP-binding protein